MEVTEHHDKIFEKVSFSEKELKNRMFEKCTFINCDFSNSSLATNGFMECKFTNCNLAMTKLHKSKMQDVFFKDCKLIGVNFYECIDFLFHVDFENCILDYASFDGKKMLKTKFINCSLKDANFSNADLSDSDFRNCNLEGTIFNKTQLKSVDFTTSLNFTLDPDLNSIKKAKFSKHSLEGLLAKYDIVVE